MLTVSRMTPRPVELPAACRRAYENELRAPTFLSQKARAEVIVPRVLRAREQTGGGMFVVRVLAPAQRAEALDAAFEAGEMAAVSWTDWEAGTVRYELYAPDRAEADRQAAELRSVLDSTGQAGESVTVEELPDQDWQESWKAFFHWERVSPRLAVTPPWETPEVGSEVRVIRIDPGMSFGTGRHPTTRACLGWLDRLADTHAAAGFCDVGSGSGILAIGASLLGYTPVAAVECDAVAVESARRNLEANSVGHLSIDTADIDAWTEGRTFAVVAANMIAGRLIRHAPAVACRVASAPGSSLILAGAMADQYAGVAAAYTALGLREQARRDDPPWVSAVFIRP